MKSEMEVAHSYFGVQGTATPLPSERDQNFRLSSADGEFVLKIAQVGEERALLDCQNEILHLLASHEQRFRFPRVRPALNGQEIVEVTDENGCTRPARMVKYLPGEPLALVRPHTPELLHSIGVLFGALDRVLVDYKHSAAERDFYWDVRHGPATIQQNLAAVRSEE